MDAEAGWTGRQRLMEPKGPVIKRGEGRAVERQPTSWSAVRLEPVGNACKLDFPRQ
jgi:hypothetical protein